MLRPCALLVCFLNAWCPNTLKLFWRLVRNLTLSLFRSSESLFIIFSPRAKKSSISPRYSFIGKSRNAQKRLTNSRSRIATVFRLFPVALIKSEVLDSSFKNRVAAPMYKQLRICWRVKGTPLFTRSKMSKRACSGTFASITLKDQVAIFDAILHFWRKFSKIFFVQLCLIGKLKLKIVIHEPLKVDSRCNPSTTTMRPSSSSPR